MATTKLDGLPAIPTSWLIALLLVGMVTLRALNIDSWTTAILSSIAGYLLGKEIQTPSSVGTTTTTTTSNTSETTQLQDSLDAANIQIKDLEKQLATLTKQAPPA